MTWLSVIRAIAARLPLRLIMAENDQLYLERYKLIGWMPGDERRWPFSVYLHRFHQPDLDTVTHSHPWQWAISLVLAGGYTEVRQTPGGEQYRALFPGDVNVLRSNTFHRIVRLHGLEVWTLFVVGPKSGSWGFSVPGRGFIPWRERLAERGIPT